MAYERTWQPMAAQGPYVATTHTDGVARFIWTLAQMLLGRIGTATTGLWTIHGSCDGTAFGLSDGVDRWGSVYDVSKIPWATTDGSTHGWMILKRNWTVNATPFTTYLLLAANGGFAATSGQAYIFCGLGTPTGGSTTTNPTIPIKVFGPVNRNSVGVSNANDFTNPRRFYGNMTSNGDFWFCQTIQGEIVAGAALVNPVGTKPNDQCPFFGFEHYLITAVGGVPFGGAYLYNRGSDTNNVCSPSTYYNGAANAAPAIDQPPAFALLDASDVSIFDKPAFITVGNAAAVTGLHSRGRLPDTGLSCGVVSGTAAQHRAVNIGTTIKNQLSEIEYVTLNQMIVPYNGTIS